MSFQSNLSSSSASASFHSQLSEQSESKEEVISSLLNKVRSHNKVEGSKILLAMSNSVENCVAMRQCGCLPLLIQLLHSPDENSNTYHMVHAKRVNFEIRERASQVLHNIVFSQPDDKKGRREARVLRLLEQIRDYCDQLRSLDSDIDDNRNARCVDQHLGPSVAALMKLSFDEEHRYAMCQLGGLQAIAELLQIDHEVHGCTSDQYCITIRRYSGMALTNLTFGDGANKALLCSMRPFMEALVAQLYSPSEDLRQVTASVLRNLSWRADPSSKRILRDVGAVTTLVKAAMEAEKESTLKSILSALWNLSAHCSGNKADICMVEGALAFLVGTLTYKSKAKTLAIVENGGGILRNVSSHIAIQNDYRVILRKHNCLQILLQHLKSPSLTVVSNACGTLWNLSARNAADQRALWEMGAVGMLKKLINSKHKMISMGSSAALKNLLSAKPPGVALGLCVHGDTYKCSNDAPSLSVRKQKALSTEIDQNLSETYDNTDSPKTSPINHGDKNNRSRRHMSPSARYMTAQKQRNDLLSIHNRQADEDRLSGSYVVEEKHNGAFQVTKNAKQALNYRQGQNRFQLDGKEKSKEEGISRHVVNKNSIDNNFEPSKVNFRPGRNDKQDSALERHSKFNKPESATKNTSNVPPPSVVKKDSKTPEHLTNYAQKTRVTTHEDRKPIPNSAPKPNNETSSNPSIASKPFHESKIPLPKSMSKADSQRSQSASPVAQRRVQSQQRQDIVQPKTVDITVTLPKYAWNASYEKEDNDPEQPFNLSKRLVRDEHFSQEHAEDTRSQPPNPLVSRLQHDDYNYGSEDEVRVYNTENTPSNQSVMSSMTDLDDQGATARCSLNIKTNTSVKLMKNHPLLANANSHHRAQDENPKLFESRHNMKGDNYHDFGGGKTVDFSVQSDYDIDETLSMMSRSSSVASISSFDQQSFHDDESFASDLSHRTSGIESPSELSDSPCHTVPSSPQKKSSEKLDRGVPEQVWIQPPVSGGEDESPPRVIEEDVLVVEEEYSEEQGGAFKNHAIDESAEPHTSSPIQEANEAYGLEKNKETGSDLKYVQDGIKETSSTDIERHHFTNDQVTSVNDPVQHLTETLESDNLNPAETQHVSRSSSMSSVSIESIEDISPSERVMLEECIRAGMPQGARQKIPQLSYQLLHDTVERHPKACRYDSERGTFLKNLEIKDNEYESLSENEEKGKEDERKAEKNRLFRIPESPVDKKQQSVTEVANKTDYVTQDNTASGSRTRKVIMNQKGNRRPEKYQNIQVKPKASSENIQNVVESVPNQLSFLMSNHKICSSETKTTCYQSSNEYDGDSEVLDRNQDTDEFETIAEEKEHPPRTYENAPKCKASYYDDKKPPSLNRNTEKKIVSPSKYTNDVPDDYSADSSQVACKKNEENFEKDIDCCEKDNSGGSDECMLSSSILCEAREIAEALLGARVDSTEDMTVSTLSCLSDIDNARPPSVMGDLGSLSMTNSTGSEENLKAAVTRECQKLFGKSYSSKQIPSTKKSLLRELQMGRLNSDHGSNENSKISNESPENLSLQSYSASDLLGNVNPPSIMDDMSLTASTGSLSEMECSESECERERNIVAPYLAEQDSMTERMHDAAAMAQLYAKELSNITGNVTKDPGNNDSVSRVKMPTAMHEVMEVTVADVTEMGCDTIGSDTELDDELPCDDEDPGSDTLQAPFTTSLSKDDPADGSTENLTLTLTEEQPRADLSSYLEFQKHSGCIMTTEEFRALQENADMILNTLREAEIADEDISNEGNSNGDMLEDETMSLVSNESDEEFLSPDGTGHQNTQKSPRNDFISSPIGMPQCGGNVLSKYSSRKTSFQQASSKNKVLPNGLPKTNSHDVKKGYSYSGPGVNTKEETYAANSVPYNTNEANMNDSPFSKLRAPTSNKKLGKNMNYSNFQANSSEIQNTEPAEHLEEAFDSRTFTRKKATLSKDLIPSVQPSNVALNNKTHVSSLVKSPSANNVPSFPARSENICASKPEANKVVTSKIASAWKNSGKVRSKSAVDANRNSKFRLESSASSGSGSSISSRDEDKIQRSSSQTPSPKSPLSRSNTFEKLNDEEYPQASSIRRPSTLALAQKTNSPRHLKGLPPPQRIQHVSQKPATENLIRPTRTVIQRPEDSRKNQPCDSSILSPTSYQSSGNIPKMQNKAQASLIPSRRSMIPTPAKFGVPDN